MTHDQLSDLVTLYAIDALEGEELATVEAHVATCAACRDELDASRSAIAALVPDSEAPAAVWHRIAAEIDRFEAPAPSNVVVLEAQRGLRRWRLVAAVAAAAALVLGVFSVAQRALISDLTGELAIAAAAQRAAEQPGSFVGDFIVEGEPVAQVVLTHDGHGYIVPSDRLPTLDPTRAYQLWVINDEGAVISAGVLGHTPTAVTFTWTGPVAGFALTREVAGGVVSSEGDVVSVITDV